MAGKKIPVDDIPFFWTRNYDKSLHYTGHANSFDEVFIDGSLNDYKFVAYYLKANKILAAAAMGSGPAIMIINEAMK